MFFMQLPASSCTAEDVLICKGAVGASDLAWLQETVMSSVMRDSLVSNMEDESHGDVEWVVNKTIRDTQEVDLSRVVTDKLDAIIETSARSFIDPFFRVQVRDWERVQVLHYGVGGHYIPHVDAETLYKDESGLELWEKTLDRDLSIVLFLNDDFEGGELDFPVLDLSIKPGAGTLVCFPSDHHFVHGVRPVTAGHRYTAVTWMRVHGTPSVDEINRMWFDEYERAWPEQIEQFSYIAKRRRG